MSGPIASRTIEIPAIQVPSFRYQFAIERGTKQLMMTTAGGLGDQVAAEPTLRHAFKLFKDWDISLLTSFPELYAHLPFKSVYTSGTPAVADLVEEDWLTLHTYSRRQNMSDDFIAHHYTHAVDYASLLAFQRQLPTDERNIMLPTGDFWINCQSIKIVVHPGRHWPANTFPDEWWSAVIAKLASQYPHQVAIVGRDVDEHTGTARVYVPDGAVDMRNKLSLPNLISLLKHARVVVTNDSAPLHIAASGHAHILYVASAKHADFITHWRRPSNAERNVWGWRMQNMGHEGLWHQQDSNPVRTSALDVLTQPLPEGVLPQPSQVVNRARMLI